MVICWKRVLSTPPWVLDSSLLLQSQMVTKSRSSMQKLNSWIIRSIQSRIAGFNPHVIGFQTFCANLIRCRKVAETAKAWNPAVKIVFGGVQSTLFPDDQLVDSLVDFVVLGEGEIAFSHLLRFLDQGGNPNEVPGIAFKDSEGRVVYTPRPPLIEKLDELPFPALHLFPMDRYHSSAQLRGSKTLHLFTSRGCPFNCSYCSGDLIFGKTFRFRSPESVINDIRTMISAFGIDSLQFYDETFTVNRERVLLLCDAMIKNNLSIPWACFTRVDLVDEELLSKMREAGCYQIFFGVETGVERLLKLIRKGTTLRQARKTFKLCRKLGNRNRRIIHAFSTDRIDRRYRTINSFRTGTGS